MSRAARVDFEEAAARLTFPPDQAVARFKLADTLFILTNYAGAASNYGLVLSLYQSLPEVTNSLFDLALYQIAEADIQRGDTNGAYAAVEKILRLYPGSYYGARGSLLKGEGLTRKNDYDNARNVFAGVLERSPHSPLLPALQCAIARTTITKAIGARPSRNTKNGSPGTRARPFCRKSISTWRWRAARLA